MQAGLPWRETGFTRAKNAGNIIAKNLMILPLVPLVLAYRLCIVRVSGAFIEVLIRCGGEIIRILPPSASPFPPSDFPDSSGSSHGSNHRIGCQGRSAPNLFHCIYSAVISAVVWSVSGHWIWAAVGWPGGISRFRGIQPSICAAGQAPIGARILGPRIGK